MQGRLTERREAVKGSSSNMGNREPFAAQLVLVRCWWLGKHSLRRRPKEVGTFSERVTESSQTGGGEFSGGGRRGLCRGLAPKLCILRAEGPRGRGAVRRQRGTVRSL